MHVVMVADYPAPGTAAVGGPQVATTRLATALAAQGVEVTVVAPAKGQRPAPPVRVDERVELLEVTVDRRLSLLTGLRTFRRSVGAAARSLGPDIVHAQGLVPFGTAAAEARPLPLVVTARGSTRADTLVAYGGIGAISRAFVLDRFGRAVAKRADVVVGVNPDWTVNVPSRPRRFVYIPNIVADRFYELEARPEPGVVLFLGGGKAIKGWSLLCEAWRAVRARCADARLLALGWSGLGPPELPSDLRDSVTIERWQPPERVAESMARASVLVIPSQFEVSPNAMDEAWALGLPVVATRVGGVPAFADGAARLVAPEASPLAAGIVAALRGGPETARLVSEGRSRAESHRATAVASAHIDLYRELLAEGASGGAQEAAAGRSKMQR